MDEKVFLSEVSELLARSPGNDDLSRAEFDDVLTTGYAHALALEAERLRLQRRLGAAARAGASGLQDGDLTAIAARATETEQELAQLRRLLGALRRHRPAPERDVAA